MAWRTSGTCLPSWRRPKIARRRPPRSARSGRLCSRGADQAPLLMKDKMSTEQEITRVAVVGGGQMGTGIAHAFALAGFNVALVDPNDAALARAMGAISGI